jgi:two-component system, chemotaxis family, protein-glutamate methylesterase/glutaminase
VVNKKKVFLAVGNGQESEALARLIKSGSDCLLTGTASNQNGLIEQIIESCPDAILLDLDTFGPDPVAAVKDIMRLCPAPIILMSGKNENAALAFEAISAGALTVVKKPSYFDLRADEAAGAPLLKAIKTYSEIKVIRHVHGGIDDKNRPKNNHNGSQNRLVAIASSTGGPLALKAVLSVLPATFPAGIVIAQHITQGFTTGLVDWLDAALNIKVKEPVDGEIIRPGIAYISPDGYHISVERGDKIVLDDSGPIKGHRPSCTKLLKSVAQVYGDRAIGVILSGMGSDGAEGLKEIREAGGHTIAQDEKTSVVFGMPKVAFEIGAVNRTTALDRIGWEILREFK